MSSLFQGLFEHIAKYNTTPLPSSLDPKTMVLGQVLNVITGEELEEAFTNGDFDQLDEPSSVYKYVGTINVKLQGPDSNKYENEVRRLAFPLDRGHYRLPLPGELVLIVAGNSVGELPEYKAYYYSRVITGASPVRNSVQEVALTAPAKVTKGPKLRLPGQQAALEKLASGRFEKKFSHKTVTMNKEGKVIPTMHEGDKILEGRFGSSIRFTSTIDQEGAWPKTPFNIKGSTEGDPFIMIKNSKNLPPEEVKDESLPQLVDDDINADMSSIYINTSQNFSMIVNGSAKMYSWNVQIERSDLSVREDLTAKLQEFFPDSYDPNQIVSVTANIDASSLSVNNGAEGGGTGWGTGAAFTGGESVSGANYGKSKVLGTYDVKATLGNAHKKQLIDNYGWPVKLVGGTNAEVIGDNSGRHVYQIDPSYIEKNIIKLTYKSKSYKVHKITAGPLQEVLQKIDADGLLQYADNIQASIYARDTTGPNKGNLSGHSFGVALDVNPDRFPYDNLAAYTSAINNPSSPNHNYARVVKTFIDSGLFNWGGNYRGSKDPHHFSVKPYDI